MDWQVWPLRHHIPGAVKHAAGIVASGFQDGRVGGLRQYDPHFLRDFIEAVFDDFECCRIILIWGAHALAPVMRI